MNRRGFLRGALGAAVGVVAGAELVEALTPSRTIFLPPRGGWFSGLDLAYGSDVTSLHTAIGRELDALAASREPIYYNDEGFAQIEARIHAAIRKFGETDDEFRRRVMGQRYNFTLQLPGQKPIPLYGYDADEVFVG